mmetsp:Transcript_24202/g.76111  ORF Transcript_24202/g.76111 Transcript_24202/m.76111 type:complete len:202 (+) Transcript_24202:428-1033(+)
MSPWHMDTRLRAVATPADIQHAAARRGESLKGPILIFEHKNLLRGITQNGTTKDTTTWACSIVSAAASGPYQYTARKAGTIATVRVQRRMIHPGTESWKNPSMMYWVERTPVSEDDCPAHSIATAKAYLASPPRVLLSRSAPCERLLTRSGNISPAASSSIATLMAVARPRQIPVSYRLYSNASRTPAAVRSILRVRTSAL